MVKEPKTQNRFADTPRDKPIAERAEHSDLERAGAQAHPKAARGWNDYVDPVTAWRMR